MTAPQGSVAHEPVELVCPAPRPGVGRVDRLRDRLRDRLCGRDTG